MEVLVNFEVSKDKYGVGSEQTTESNSLMVGLFLPVLSQDVMGGDLSAKVLVGLSDNNSDRKVLNNSLGLTRSSEIVSGDYKSAYVSVGTEWLTQFFKRERATHAFSVGADVVQAYVEDYSAGEYKVDDRHVTQLQVRAHYQTLIWSGGKKLSIAARLGIAYQGLLLGDKQDYKINGTSTSYKGDDSNTYYNAELGAKYYLADATNLYVDTKVGRSRDAISNITVDFGFISHF
jgi:hypothetical protein